MPSDKNRVQCLLDDEYHKKFKYLLKKEKRKSDSALAGYIIEKYIDDYEAAHGEINLEE